MAVVLFAASGSSPHSRGAPAARASAAQGERIIPAFAGSTRTALLRDLLLGDHPRIRGEHVRLVVSIRVQVGSSPHSRGARPNSWKPCTPRRIIPAFAGSTGARRLSPYRSRDHPRIRGEHYGWKTGAAHPWGSSPHSRGAHHQGLSDCARPGIIPAFAGSTRCCPAVWWRSRDHPRIRGEHAGVMECSQKWTGSSPHSRGAQPRHDLACQDRRIIPAFAGSTYLAHNA